MTERSTEELVGRLRSDDGMASTFAAEELAERGERSAIGPLIEALSSLSLGDRGGQSLARSYIVALAMLEATEAADTIVGVLRQTSGDDVLPAEACLALVRLRAVDALPALESLIQTKAFAGNADELAEAIVALGGSGAAPLFVELLSAKQETVRVAAATALGALRHLDAAPALEKLLKSTSPDVRFAALGALVAMGAPRAADSLHREMSRSLMGFEKSRLLRMIKKQSLRELAPRVMEKAADPTWAESVTLRIEALAVAAFLGAAEASQKLGELATDAGQSPCARARARASLLDLDEPSSLIECIHFLERNGGHAEQDPRDPFGVANEVQLATVEALERYALRHAASLLPVVDTLHAIRREKHGNPRPVVDRAGRAVRTLTRTERYSEYDTWRAQREPSTSSKP
jgi:hypothetical protein